MYKLLLATDQADVVNLFNSIPSWDRLGFNAPVIVSDAQSAIDYLESKSVDTIGYSLNTEEAAKLNRYLSGRPSLPIYQIRHHVETQIAVMRDACRVLDQLHSDFADGDGYYNEEVMLDIMRTEFVSHLLTGEIEDEKMMESYLKLIRAHISTKKPCMLYEIDMPQGEVYLADRWHYGRERLQTALHNNFFKTYVDGIYYAVAVVTPRHIRLAAIQREDEQPEDDHSFAERANDHVQDTVTQIKEYLDLDMCIEDIVMLENVHSLLRKG